MRKLIFVFLACFTVCAAFGQSLSYQQKLYYTCKVWGFVKYYHSRVSVCDVDWDSVLVATLPSIKSASTTGQFNDALDSMIKAAGPMAIAKTPLPDTIAPQLKRNRNFSWINETVFRNDVRTALDTIKNNFRPHQNCWVKINDYSTPYPGWLFFLKDSVLSNQDLYKTYPDEVHRLLILFKYWNMINYFDPYTYVFDKPMDTILYSSVLQFANVSNYYSFYTAVRHVASQFDDAHVDGLTFSEHLVFPFGGYYYPKVALGYADGKYVVVKSDISGIAKGDALIAVNNRTVTQWEDSLRGYVSAGNEAVFHRIMYYDMLAGTYRTSIRLTTEDSNGTTHSLITQRINYPGDGWYPLYNYTVDSISSVKWTTMGCDVGYVNIENLQQSDINSMYSELMSKKAIIFDLRNYPSINTAQFGNMLYPNQALFSRIMQPDITYPGTFYWFDDILGVDNNADGYNGKVVILVNEQTQSAAEFFAMILKAMPDAVIIGSQTAGTDGNVTYSELSKDIFIGFTSLGIYYPNGDSTERIGIVPDIEVKPTQAGIRHSRDEVLEKALAVACNTSVAEKNRNEPEIKVYPNPTTGSVTVAVNGLSSSIAEAVLTDITGKVVLQKPVEAYNGAITTSIDMQNLSKGIYFLSLKCNRQVKTIKMVKM
jgi:hypothetical protein